METSNSSVKLKEINKNIYMTSAAATIFTIQLYLLLKQALISERISALTERLGNAAAQKAAVGVIFMLIEFVVFASLHKMYYRIACKYFNRRWILRHKNIWVKGLWLHIHVKNNIRVGTVEVDQDFYSVSAKGINTDPAGAGSDVGTGETVWNYYIGEVKTGDADREFIGCYTAKKIAGGSNDGMHVLKCVSRDGKGFPVRLMGNFYDTFRESDKKIRSLNVGERSGQLFFFKPTPKCVRHLAGKQGGVDLRKLATLHLEEDFRDEPYVAELLRHMENKTARRV